MACLVVDPEAQASTTDPELLPPMAGGVSVIVHPMPIGEYQKFGGAG